MPKGILKKIAWRLQFERIRHICLIDNIIAYGKFSYNPNTKRHWNKTLADHGFFWRNIHYYYIADLLPRDKEFSLLDIGCAMGDGCELLQEKFPKAEIAGIDISDVGIGKAREKNKKIHYFLSDILKDPIKGDYDYITIVQTMEHFDDSFYVLDKCLKHVRKVVIITVPYSESFSGRIKNGLHTYSFNKGTFKDYNCAVVKITEYIKRSRSRCIIYKISPK